MKFDREERRFEAASMSYWPMTKKHRKVTGVYPSRTELDFEGRFHCNKLKVR